MVGTDVCETLQQLYNKKTSLIYCQKHNADLVRNTNTPLAPSPPPRYIVFGALIDSGNVQRRNERSKLILGF